MWSWSGATRNYINPNRRPTATASARVGLIVSAPARDSAHDTTGWPTASGWVGCPSTTRSGAISGGARRA
ncbi:hypothetical protein GCM10023175_66550 [Pseudonocardia xishanensis]|uniref:Uncharacterized protein n=1 Tax=Pseudonocardia xishanensis TaxID=630995 RepID=A0ABP8S2C0_9PSEU